MSTAQLPAYVAKGMSLHLHGTDEPGWLEHVHLAGDRPHAHDAETGGQIGLHPDGTLAPHLWPCGCLINDAGAHRGGCPDHPGGVNPKEAAR